MRKIKNLRCSLATPLIILIISILFISHNPAYPSEECDGYYISRQYLQAADCYFNKDKDYDRAGDSYRWAGNVAVEQGNYTEAIGYYQLAIQQFEKVPNYTGIGDSYYMSGQASYNLRQLETVA